jgi:Lrp/AsnC family transcriptional regulator for asnA, asnC and gidA
MVYELDGLDKKIIAELDINSRQPVTILSKKLHRNRNVIEYRINKLQEEGIIKNFVTLLDSGRLGLTIWNVYLELENTNKKIEERIIQHLNKNKKVWWVAQTASKWNFIYSVYVRDIKELYEIINKFNLEFGKYILNQSLVAHIEAEIFSRSYLVNQPSTAITWSKDSKSEEIDELDKSILRELATNARMSSVDLAEKIGSTERVVIYRIKDLIKRKIITRFRLQLDTSKYGFHFYKVIVNLKNFEKDQDGNLKEYCRNLGNVFHYVNKIGPWMLELEMDCESYEKANELMKKMKEAFPDYIKSYEVILITNEPKGELDLTQQLK